MPALKNLLNQKFGKLTVIRRAPNKNNKVFWECQCDCGNKTIVRSDQLIRGITKSCGCLHKENASKIGHQNFKDLTGQKFGKLTAVYPIKSILNSKYYWLCSCDCGNTVEVLGTSLTSGNTKSCGCIKSIGEMNISLLLKDLNIPFIKEYKIYDNNNNYYRFDFAIIDTNNNVKLFIEYDGIQHFGRISGWFNEKRKQQLEKSDNFKNKYCKQYNIPLIRIPYWELNNMNKEWLLNKIQEMATPDMEEAQEIIEEE